MDEGDNAHEHEHDASCYNGCYCELTMPADNVATMSNVAADCSLTLSFASPSPELIIFLSSNASFSWRPYCGLFTDYLKLRPLASYVLSPPCL